MSLSRSASGFRFWPMVVLSIVLLQPAQLRAQILVPPTFVLDNDNLPIGLATAPNGDALALLTLGPTLEVLRLPGGVPGPTVGRLLTNEGFLGAAVTALAGAEGYVAAWVVGGQFPFADVRAQRIGRDGIPSGIVIPVAFGALNAESVGIAPLGTGFALAWSDYPYIDVRAFDATGAPLGPAVHAGGNEARVDVQMVAVAGGLVVLWGDTDSIDGRLLDATLTPLTAEYDVSDGTRLDRAIANADGTQVAVLRRDRRIQLFAPDGSQNTEAEVINFQPGDRRPGLAFGSGGDLLALWPRESQPQQLRGRLFGASGAALAPVRLIAEVSASGRPLYVNRRPDGDFTVVWHADPSIGVARVTLCEPSGVVCGDGTVASTCEVCDAGGANSDTLPDACRTDCRPARCGDGVTDSGEQCDDGNRTNCDGCDEFCENESGTVCGDGVVAPLGCQEQCDDANGIAGDGCSPTCRTERIFGGGSPRTDCYTVWRVDNPGNTPLVARHGSINPKQLCHDDDPGCDFDGGTPGSCTFHVAVCVNNEDLAPCQPARLRGWSIKKPTSEQAAKRPELAALRSALSATVPMLVGAGDPNVCSPDVDLVVPLRGAPGAFKSGKAIVKTVADVYDGSFDVDGLQLRCEP